MNCNGIGSGPGDSGASHASVHPVRSWRAGLPVNARDRTVSVEVAASSLSVTTPPWVFSVTVSQIEPVHTPSAPERHRGGHLAAGPDAPGRQHRHRRPRRPRRG